MNYLDLYKNKILKNNNWTNVTRKISGYYYVNGDV